MNRQNIQPPYRFFRRFALFCMMTALLLCGLSCLQRENISPPQGEISPGSSLPQPPSPGSGYTPPRPDESTVPALRLIIVADTLDSKIGRSVAIDSQNLQELMGSIAAQSNGGLVLKKIILEGESATRHNLIRAVSYPKIGENDVVVFLYSGHGHRYQTTASRWPLMDTEGGNTDFAEIIRIIRSKNPRQFIALADCCNEVVVRGGERTFRRRFSYTQIQKMFITSKAQYAASGSIPGQFSYGDDNEGGLFTSSFIAGLSSALSSSQADWEQVFEKTVSDVLMKSGNEQRPQYEKYR